VSRVLPVRLRKCIRLSPFRKIGCLAFPRAVGDTSHLRTLPIQWLGPIEGGYQREKGGEDADSDEPSWVCRRARVSKPYTRYHETASEYVRRYSFPGSHDTELHQL